MNPEVIKNLKKTLTGKASNCTPGFSCCLQTRAVNRRFCMQIHLLKFSTQPSIYQKQQKISIEIWLILPVVICLFQGLSHACLRITALQESAHGSLHQTQSAAKMLRKRIIGYLVRNAKLIHELKGSSRSTRGRLAFNVVGGPADE